jgi:hypothetical protein
VLGEDEVRCLVTSALPKASIVKLGKIITIHQGLIEKRLARFAGANAERNSEESDGISPVRAMKESRYELIIFWDSDKMFAGDTPELPGS